MKKKKDRETRLRDLRRARKRRRRRKPKRSELAWLHWEYRDLVRRSTKLQPPSDWTLTGAPDEAVRYFLTSRAGSQQQPVHHVLDDVESMDLGAAVLLSQQMSLRPNTSTSLPSRAIATMVASCGAYDNVTWLTHDGQPNAAFRRAKKRGRGIYLQSRDVRTRPEVAAKVKTWAATHAAISPAQQRALYRTILEAMSNTATHAGDEPTTVPWSLAARRIPGGVEVAFLDLGHGVLNTARLRLYNEILDPPDPEVLLEEVFRGELGTRKSRSATRKTNRGLGLPRMRDDAQAGRVQDLFVLTNSAYGIVAADRYQRLGAGMSFPGTYLFWRILEKS